MAKARSKQIEAELSALSPDAWRFCCELRTVLKKEGVLPDDALERARLETIRHFGGFVQVSSADESDVPASPTNQPPSPPGKKPDERYRSLDHFKGKKESLQKGVVWVGDMMFVADVSSEDAPSSFAWGLLQWCREGAANMTNFYTRILPALFPSRAQLDVMERENDDDSEGLELNDRIYGLIESAALQEGSQGHSGESAGASSAAA